VAGERRGKSLSVAMQKPTRRQCPRRNTSRTSRMASHSRRRSR
jgi:hypothetical protein